MANSKAKNSDAKTSGAPTETSRGCNDSKGGEKSSILISTDQQTIPVPAQGQIFDKELRHAMNLIYEVYLRAKDLKANRRDPITDEVWSELRIHQNIGILGQRGVGKTSFLLTILKLLGSGGRAEDYRYRYIEGKILKEPHRLGQEGEDKDHIGPAVSTWNEVARDVVLGGLIEPSLMESGDHVVAMAYANMLGIAQQRIRRNPPTDKKHEEILSKFLRASQEVTEHLPVLFAKKRLNKVFTEEGSEGLHDEIMKSRSGLKLERALWKFIECFLEIEGGKPLVILALDDVDLAYEKGVQVLESLRRYLTSPQMLILVTGDPALFAEVLEKEYLIGKEKDRFTKEIVSQYLKKVLPGWLRVALPDSVAATKDLNIIEMKLKGDDKEKTNGDDRKKNNDGDRKNTNGDERGKSNVTVEWYYGELLKSCLRLPMGFDDNKDEWARVKEKFRFILPEDFRRFDEVCTLYFLTDRPPKRDSSSKANEPRTAGRESRDEQPAAEECSSNDEERKEWIFLELAKVWEDRIMEFGLDHWQLGHLSRERRVGIRILNLLIRARQLDGVGLRIDPRSDDLNLNLLMAFLRFAIEANLDRQKPVGLLGLGLDFCVPSHYLSGLKADEQERAFRELDLKLIDSPRRLFQRLVPWLSRSHPDSRVQPGVVRVSSRVGTLEAYLDLHDTRQTAAWRWILGNSERVSLPSWLTEAARKSSQFLSKGFLWSDRQFRDEECETPEEAWREISGYRWATKHLPDLLFPAYKEKIFEGRELRERPTKAGEKWEAGNTRPPLVSECVTTPRLFDQLAGALPRVVLQCWTIDDGKESYLTPWQGLSLVHRVFDRLVEALRSFNLHDENNKNAQSKIEHWHVKRIEEVVSGCLEEHIANKSGPASVPGIFRITPERGILSESSAVMDHPRQWGRLLGELRTIENPEDLYPNLTMVKFRNPNYLDPRPNDDTIDAAMARVRKSMAYGSWFFDEKLPGMSNCERYRTAGNWNELQALRLEAWDRTLDKLVLAITEWALFWMPKLNSTEPRKLDFEQIQGVFDTFFNDLGDEEAFVDEWSGAGDIIQRWILTFLNSVLVRTLCSPIGEKRNRKKRPALLVGRRDRVPGRTATKKLGGAHSLYENLTRLRYQGDRKKEVLNPDEDWHPSDHFLALASFPVIGMFLPSGGPLPPIKRPRVSMEDPIGNLPGKKFAIDYECIVRFGMLMLIPEPAGMHHERRKYILDLADLSWCGLSLRNGGIDKESGRVNSLILDIEERRNALISMLNSVVADVMEPEEEPREYLAPLVLAIHGALNDKQRERFESLAAEGSGMNEIDDLSQGMGLSVRESGLGDANLEWEYAVEEMA
ncbi:MAG: hypothetical protein GY847_32135 [Proteobacteria bacterium]|nr:hypothetical protein [Pseudomonadota bacterium]